MAKRFTETDIWKKQRWFKKLHPTYKLVFCYLKDMCDHAGIWKIDCSDLMEDLGLEDFNLIAFATACNIDFDKMTGSKIQRERIKIIKSDFLWITGFIQFQYEKKDGTVNWEMAPVRTALIGLQRVGVLDEGLSKGYLTLTKPFEKGWQTLKEKDKEKESISLNSKNNNGKSFGNFKAQSENLYAARVAK